jgi:DNA-binding beta-propeller fold protein YncE
MSRARLDWPTIAAGLLATGLCVTARADYPLPPASTGNVYVSGSGSHAVFCFDPRGRFLFRFSHPELRAPRGLAFAPSGELYCGAQDADRVLVFARDGTYVRQFSAPGLDGPTSLAFGPDGKLYVSSFESDEVFVFSAEAFERAFSSDGLDGPNCVAFGPTGDIYVAAQLRNQVHRFDPAGSFIARFGGGGLSSPMGIAVWDDRLFVTGGASDSVVVFDLEGGFLRSLPTAPISGPQGIAFDERGELVTASFYTGRVARFSREGELVDEFEPVEIRVARSVAFEPLRPATFVRGDFNRDEHLDISDAVAVLGYLFLGERPSACLDAADADDDGELAITDAIHALDYLFLGGDAPPPPFPEAGGDPSEDALACYAA